MRIAHLMWSMGVGGSQTLLTDIVNIQVREGHEVGIFVIDSLMSDTIMNKLDPKVQVSFMGRTRGEKALMPFVRLNWKLFRFHPDIIHSHSGKLVKAIFSSVPQIATIHNMTSNPIDFKKYTATYAISNSVKDDWKKKGFDVTGVIENGVSCNKIRSKKNWDLKDSIHVVVLSRIRFSPKRQDLIVSALAKLKSNNQFRKGDSIVKKCVVHFIGDGEDTAKLKNMVKEYGLDDNVIFEGIRDRSWIYDHLCDYDLFIQASDFEGFGLTVAEACAAKLPVLLSNVEGPLEIIDGGRLGMTFKKGDAEDLAAQLSKFINGEYDYSLIEKAYLRTLKMYSIEGTAFKYLDEYRKILNNKGKVNIS